MEFAAAEREIVQGTIEKLNYIDSVYDTEVCLGAILAEFSSDCSTSVIHVSTFFFDQRR